MIQEYDGFSNVLEYKLNKIPVWARIKGLPDGLTAKWELAQAEKVAGKVGGPPFKVGRLAVMDARTTPEQTF